MVLCSICRGIQFDNPHPVPSEYTLPGLPDPDYPNDDLYCLQLKKGYSAPMMFGYTHYQSLPDLKSSAHNDGCGLCTLIYDEFDRIRKALTKHRSSWRFFITGREHGQKGFQVWTDGEYGMRRVGAFGYVVKHPDIDVEFAKIYPGRLVVPDSTSNASWHIARHWIGHCEKFHSNCGPKMTAVSLPKRVIDVGTNNNKLKIFETNKSSGSYIALSYSWGWKDKQGNKLTFPYRLQQTNLSNYKNNIPASVLPQTILDAIDTTRRLGIRYLWIDALCIEQRTDTDPAHFKTQDFIDQAPKMAQYYSKACLTISSAWSDTSEDGVYKRDRPSLNSYTWTHHNLEKNVKEKLTIVPLSLKKENTMPSYVIMDDEPITTRGWTLQERILSPRTLFYGTDQMYWECNEHFLSENGFRATGRMYSTDKHTSQISVWEEGTKQDPRELWAVLIESFSRRGLSDTDDKLVAVSGLAEKFGKIFKDQYLAGLWKKTVIEELFWTTDGPFMTWQATKNWSPNILPSVNVTDLKNGMHYRAPSWSWAAFDFNPKLKAGDTPPPDGLLLPSDNTLHPSDDRMFIGEKLARYVDSGTTLVGPTYGAITAGYLRLNVPVLHLHIDTDRTHVHRGQYAFTFKKRAIKYKTELDFSFQSLNEVTGIKIYAVILARDAVTEPNNPIYLCILITPVDEDHRRIGTLWIDEGVLGSHVPDFEGDWWDLNLV